MLSLIAGFQLMRQVLTLPALAQADARALVKVLARFLISYASSVESRCHYPRQ
jgi:hypothetical protein